MLKSILRTILGVMIGLVAMTGIAVSDSAWAQNAAADFFQGKTITYIVSTQPGGGYDTYGRLLARHLAKYLPGSRVIVRNVPGAAHIIGANTIYVARPDGLTFGIFNTGLIYGQLLEARGIRFDLGEMSWIGKMAEEGRTLVLSTRSGLDNVQNLIDADRPVLLASAGLGSSSYVETHIVREALGLNVRLIPGILGGDTELSMLRGEIAGALNAASSHDDFVRRGDGKYVLSISGAADHLPDVPQARDLVTDERSLSLLDLVATVAELGRLTAGPPGIPADRLEVLRDAYMAAVADPELLAQAEALNVPIQPTRGDEVAAKIRAVLDQPPDVTANLRRVVTGQ